MLQRILVAVVGIPLLLFVLIIAPDWATAALLCALCAVGAHELLAAACSKDITRRWWGLSAIMGVTVVLRTYLAGIGEDGAAALMTWLLAAWLYQAEPLRAVLYSLLFSLLTVVALIDWRTFEIPNGVNLAIFLLGAVQLAGDTAHWKTYLIGMFSVSLLFLLLWFVTKGSGLGMGDVKLMAGAGLLLGWQRILLAMILGSVSGAIIHSVRMKRGAPRKLAFGPYLAAGIWVAALWGDRLIAAYLGLFGL